MPRAIADAVRRSGIEKHAACHRLRHSFAAHLLEADDDIGRVHGLLGHLDVTTTMAYVHILNRGGLGVRSPADTLFWSAGLPDSAENRSVGLGWEDAARRSTSS